MALPKPNFVSYENYREGRRTFLEACCKAHKLKYPDAKDIVGIASEPVREGEGSSEDLLYLDGRKWDSDQEEEAIKLCEQLDILQEGNYEIKRFHDKEYPDVD
jgi:hypothetical protein